MNVILKIVKNQPQDMDECDFKEKVKTNVWIWMILKIDKDQSQNVDMGDVKVIEPWIELCCFYSESYAAQ